MATVASTLTSASVLKVAAAAVTTAVAAAASSHSSVRRRSKATGISGTQHAVSVAAVAAVATVAALAANDHSADSDRSVTGLMTQMASALTLGAASRTPQPTLVAKVVNQNQLYLLHPFEDLHCLFNTTNPI
ncbi:hypothetical protein BASA83_006456 [Batrachochytrium salamandrivorans]|nr:hypothetical protein BASA83_006456 [Batrachochytrium salamandrivorans]